MIINLRKNQELLNDYIRLRNRYASNLVTEKVNLDETKNWLKNNDVEIICEYKNKKVLGVCILHVYRNGEITIFTDEYKKGVGTKLIYAIEKIAKIRNITKTWAWVREDNFPANCFFLKIGYTSAGKTHKPFKNKKTKGIIYEKLLV